MKVISFEDEEYRVCTHPEVRPDFYIISNYGQVYSIRDHKLKKASLDKDGYKQTTMVRPLNSNKSYKPFRIHQLVAHEFLERDDTRNMINHINTLKYDNYYKNLEYCNASENAIHAYDNNLSRKGEEHHFNKYPEYLIHNICRYISLGYSNIEIMNVFGYSKATNNNFYNLIKDLRRRKVWRHVNQQYDY